jgi:hypothetical protein
MDTFVRFVSRTGCGRCRRLATRAAGPPSADGIVGSCGKAAGHGGAPISWGELSGTGMRLRKGRARRTDPADPAPSLIAVLFPNCRFPSPKPLDCVKCFRSTPPPLTRVSIPGYFTTLGDRNTNSPRPPRNRFRGFSIRPLLLFSSSFHLGVCNKAWVERYLIGPLPRASKLTRATRRGALESNLKQEHAVRTVQARVRVIEPAQERAGSPIASGKQVGSVYQPGAQTMESRQSRMVDGTDIPLWARRTRAAGAVEL